MVGGDSAGGNLACVISSLARDGLDGDLLPCPTPIRITHQLLIYPALFMHRMVEENFVDVSAFLPKPVTRWFIASYVPESQKGQKAMDELVLRERRLCPFNVGFENMPPTTLISAGLDHLRHENRIAAQQFELSGVDIVHRHYEHVPHGFVTFHFLKESALAIDQICKDLSRSSSSSSSPTSGTRMDDAAIVVVGRRVEVLGCQGMRGTVRSVAASPSAHGEDVSTREMVAEVDLGWGKAYCPLSNVLILN